MTSHPVPQRFLARQRLALVNVSVVASDPSRQLFRELLRRGNDVFPIRPGVTEIEGRPAYAQVQDVPVQLAGAILIVAPHLIDRVVAACVEARVPELWIATPELWIASSPHVRAAKVLARHGTTVSTINIAEVLANGGARRRNVRDSVRWLGDRLGLTPRAAGPPTTSK